MIYHSCDRCGEKIPGTSYNVAQADVYWRDDDEDYCRRDLHKHLCVTCRRALIEFLEGGGR